MNSCFVPDPEDDPNNPGGQVRAEGDYVYPPATHLSEAQPALSFPQLLPSSRHHPGTATRQIPLQPLTANPVLSYSNAPQPTAPYIPHPLNASRRFLRQSTLPSALLANEPPIPLSNTGGDSGSGGVSTSYENYSSTQLTAPPSPRPALIEHESYTGSVYSSSEIIDQQESATEFNYYGQAAVEPTQPTSHRLQV